MFKSYFFLGLGIGMIISGSLFWAFSDKNERTSDKPKTEFAQVEEKENVEREEFKKLLKEIESLKDDKDEPKNSEKNNEEDADSSKLEKKKIAKEKVKLAEKETVAKAETTKEEQANLTNETNVETEEKKTEEKKVEKKAKTVAKKTSPKKVVKKGKITILENKENNTLAYRISAEKYQIQFRSSKNFNDSERIKNILKDVIDTETILLGEYYRLFSKETFSEEIAKDVAEKIGKVYNLRTVVWFSDYNMIFKEDKDIKNCESLQKKIMQFVDTTIKFENDMYVLQSKRPLAKNLAVDIAKYINKDMTLDIIIKLNI